MKRLSAEEWLRIVQGKNGARKYGAMYSTWFDGIVTDVELMSVPIDDHLVHRGDGVFEAIAFADGEFFEMDAHLDRLYRSAELIGLKISAERRKLFEICSEVVKASGFSKGNLRIFASRGPGDFSPNPYSTVGSQLYVVALPEPQRNAEWYEKGASLIFSTVPVKPYPYAQIKSCNYLQNVMTKKESLDRGADFGLNLTESGFVAEGPTENLLILTAAKELLSPNFDYTLRGTTLLRVFQIAETLQVDLQLSSLGQRDLTKQDVESALEVMMVGTTLGVCPITRVEGKPIGDGHVGQVALRLNQELF